MLRLRRNIKRKAENLFYCFGSGSEAARTKAKDGYFLAAAGAKPSAPDGAKIREIVSQNHVTFAKRPASKLVERPEWQISRKCPE